MPNRIFKESILVSFSVNALSAEGERMLERLILVADDFGRFAADPIIVLSKCFPLKVKAFTVTQISTWLTELVNAPQGSDESPGIIRLYEVNGQRLGYFTKWLLHNSCRALKSKFPDPTDGAVVAAALAVVKTRRSSTSGNEYLNQTEWGKPGCLMTFYILNKPASWTPLPQATPGRIRKEQEYLKAFPDQDFWRSVMIEIPKSAFLMGRVAGREQDGNPRRPFKGSFDWLVQRGKKDGLENCVKIAEGQYRDPEEKDETGRRPPAGGTRADQTGASGARYDGI